MLINGDRAAIAPIPELILTRITSGLYYDIIPGGQPLLNEANSRFERYCVDLFQLMLPKLAVSGSHKYNIRNQELETPDVLLRTDGQAKIVVECKATKLTFLAQFGDDPFEEARRGFEQISKAVFQIWRYFSHSRRGLLGEHGATSDAQGIVLTLDAWLYVSRELQPSIYEQAQKLAEIDPEISEDDRRPVAFCSIEDLERILSRSSETTFDATLAAAHEERFHGWMLSEVNREVLTELKADDEGKVFPFNLGDVLPWWRQITADGLIADHN